MAPNTARQAFVRLVTASCLCAGCANGPPEPSLRESIAAEGSTLRASTAPAPQLMAKQPGALRRVLQGGTSKTHGESCPMRVPETILSAEVVEEGVALVFTTYGDVEEVRRRVRELAYTHSHEGVMEEHSTCGCPLVASDGVPLMAEASTRAQAIPRGAKLVLTPNERNELPRIRATVSRRLEQLAAANCPLRDERRAREETARR